MKFNNSCPVCLSNQSEKLLSLDGFPIYQHPIPRGEFINPPYAVDLEYYICSDCRHAYQSNYDVDVLEGIYSNYYYTPRPEDIATEATNEFSDSLSKYISNSGRALGSILEIGCSCGEVLDVISTLSPNSDISAFEPNNETRKVALEKGYRVFPDFCGTSFSKKHDKKYDFIFSRHVIEHIFDFKDFFSAINDLSKDSTVLALETPCLDYVLKNKSMAGFHIEHVSYFSRSSLVRLLSRHGWKLEESFETKLGNMIMFFNKGIGVDLKFPDPDVDSFQLYVDESKSFVSEKLKSSNKKIAMWGAGSLGRIKMSFMGFTPTVVIDSNPNKVSRYYPGIPDLNIMLVDDWISLNYLNQDEWVILIASTFVREISRKIKSLGWSGEVLDISK